MFLGMVVIIGVSIYSSGVTPATAFAHFVTFASLSAAHAFLAAAAVAVMIFFVLLPYIIDWADKAGLSDYSR